MKNKKIYISLLGVMILYSVLWLVPKTDSPKLNLRDILLPARNVKLIAVGDLNMGRHTGQQLLKGDIAFPFAYITDYLKDADIAFGNLESQLADLDGETQSPTNEY
ncbi:MAG: CapA family protein, partial [Patescibacteria group bacterium]|nr:CapA family protein [Patescibacteria group bacterium]